MSKILPEVLEANAKYSANFGDKGKLAMPPARRFAILTCMDARLDPAKFAGLAEGDAHVIRNAGGRASDDAIRSLVISYKLLGTQEFFVIHHTDCGMSWLTIQDQRQSMLDDVAHIRNHPARPQVHPRSRLYLRRGPWKAYGGGRCSRGWRLRLITRLHRSKIEQPRGHRPVGLVLHCPSIPRNSAASFSCCSWRTCCGLTASLTREWGNGAVDGDSANRSHNSSDDGPMDREM